MWRKWLETAAAIAASQMLAMRDNGPTRLGDIVAGTGNLQNAFAERQRLFDTLGDPRAGLLLYGDAIDNDGDIVLTPAIDDRRRVDGVCLAVDPDSRITGGTNLFPPRLVLFTDRHIQRSHQVQPSPFRLRHDLVDNLIDGLRPDFDIAVGTVKLTGPRHEDAEVIVDLGDRANRAARCVAEILLFDGDGRRKPVDVLDLRFLHLPDELASVRAEAFDVAALPFGIDRVHSERTLARTTRPAKDRHLVASHSDVDAFEVVLIRAGDGDLLGDPGQGIARLFRLRGPGVRPLCRRTIEEFGQRLACVGGERGRGGDKERGRRGVFLLVSPSPPLLVSELFSVRH